MTTYTLDAVIVTNNTLTDDYFNLSYESFDLVMFSPVDSFTYVDDPTSTEPDAIDVLTNGFLDLRLDGQSVASDLLAGDAFVFTINWGAGKSTTLMSIDVAYPGPNLVTSVSLVLGGDALPQFASAQELEDFLANSVTGRTPFGPGPLGPGQSIDLDDLPGVSVSENDRVDGSNQNDDIRTGDGRDVVRGKGGNDKIFGQDGNDKLFGQNGNDIVKGGDGHDWIYGGAGRDKLFGDDGRDKFVYSLGDGRDFIRDFEDNVDTLRLDSDLFAGPVTVQDVIDMAKINANGDCVFNFGGGDKLILKGVSDADILLNDLVIF